MNYTVDSPADAPASLTFGPPFFALAAQLSGSPEVTLGLNRQLDDQPASLAAAVRAKQTMGNLFALELGNEPECECGSPCGGCHLTAHGSRLCERFTDRCRGGARDGTKT